MEEVWIEGYVLCGEANKFYRCVTCDQSCGIEGHFIEETKSKNPKREFVNNTSKWNTEDFEKVIDQEAIDYSVYNEQINKAVQAAVKHGINLQRKRSYSEEDLRKAIQETITLMRYKATEFREHENTIIEQFKKK